MAPYKIIKQGYMLKEPPSSKRGLRKKLRRYWFVLLEDKKQVAFVYYKNEDAYIARQRNVGFIRIDNSRINVIGEYLTHKNAFSVVTERSNYIFIPESRYELHDWIFILHNSLEGFHRRTEKVRVRQEQRQRALSASSAASGNVHAPGIPTTPTQPLQPAGTTPASNTDSSAMTTPNRTPPNRTPPNASPRMGSSAGGSKRRPNRPAPLAPVRKEEQRTSPLSAASSHTPNHTPNYAQEFHSQYSHEGPAFMSMSQTSTSPYSTMELGQHPVMDLEITQIEELQRDDDGGEGDGERETAHTGEVGRDADMQQARGSHEEPPSPVHRRSVSDTSVLLSRTNSSSLPDLKDNNSSVSPEDMKVPDTVEGARRQMSEKPPVARLRTKHTRHLSLLIGAEEKQKKQRQPSLKNRSRSPPNYPPPPPPTEDSGNEAVEGAKQQFVAPSEAAGGASRKHSPGISQVMKKILSIDHKLEEMGGVGASGSTPNITPPLKFRAIDPRHSPLSESPEEEGRAGDFILGGSLGPKIFLPPLNGIGGEENLNDGGQESELIEKNLSPTHTCITEKKVTTQIFFPEKDSVEDATELWSPRRSDAEPVSPRRSNTEPVSPRRSNAEPVSPRRSNAEPVSPRRNNAEPLSPRRSNAEPVSPRSPNPMSPGSSNADPMSPRRSNVPPPVAAKPKPKPKPKKNRVMFKEEVEDIPSYEPRIDNEEAAPHGDDENAIPSSVAGLKKMLFGGQVKAQKYTKDGPMSLRFGAIVDTDGYDEDLHAMLSPGRRQASFSPEERENSVSPRLQVLSPFSNSLQGDERAGHGSVSPQDEGIGPGAQKVPDMVRENEYDAPWDSKPISKYSVVAHRKQTPSPRPTQRAEQFEVETHTTAVPGNMERRNVHSLERQLRRSPDTAAAASALRQTHVSLSPSPAWEEAKTSSLDRDARLVSPPQQPQHFSPTQTNDSDLLQSINSTLQSRSKFGSDSLLSMGQKESPSQGDAPANYPAQEPAQGMQQENEVRRSARTDLERIRTQYRRGEGSKPAAAPGPAHPGHHNGQLQQPTRVLSHSQQSVDRGMGGGVARRRGRGGFAGHKNARKAQSVDGLQADPSTLVTYDTHTHSHTYRSLV